MIVYLAGPYSSPYIHIRDRRYHQLSYVAAELMKQGNIVYSPITSCHHLACDFELPFDANYWLRHDLEFLRRCGKLLVLQLEGWENSVGLKKEIEFAEDRKIPIEYVTLEKFLGKNN